MANPANKYIDHLLAGVFPILGGSKLHVVWTCGEEAVVDLATLIQHKKRFLPLAQPASFQAVRVEDWGATVEWACGIVMGSDQIRQMADDQGSVFRRRLAG